MHFLAKQGLTDSGFCAIVFAIYAGDAIAKMRGGVIVLNFARGAPVDEEAMAQALERGNLTHCVNYPNYDMGVCTAAERITILYGNIPSSPSRFRGRVPRPGDKGEKMSATAILRAFALRHGGISRYIPFLNHIGLNGTALHTSGSVLWRTKISCRGQGNTIQLGRDCVLRNCHIFIRGNANRVMIQSGVHAANAEIWIEDDNNVVTIGEKTLLCGKIHLACTEGSSITMGRECLCSSEIVIRTGDSHSIVNEEGRRLNFARPVTIGDHVWIGYHAWLTKGAQVPDNSVVGTAAVVTKAFTQTGVVLAGNPAGVIRENINWCVQRLPASDEGFCG